MIKNTAERGGEKVYLELSLDHTVPAIQYLTFINYLRYLEMMVNEQNMKFENVFFCIFFVTFTEITGLFFAMFF